MKRIVISEYATKMADIYRQLLSLESECGEVIMATLNLCDEDGDPEAEDAICNEVAKAFYSAIDFVKGKITADFMETLCQRDIDRVDITK